MATSRVMGTLTRVSTSAPLVALTFDDGPHSVFTLRVLAVLERYDARATFFMVGEAAQRLPYIVARVAAAGHVVGGHSWDHPSFPLISRKERVRQIRACAQALRPYGQAWFRPPFGHQDLATRFDLWRMGYRVVAWSAHALDSQERDPDAMAARLIDRIRPGSIVLLHDSLFTLLPESNADRSAMLEALERVLAELSGRLRFVTVPELIRAGRPHWDNWLGVPPRDFMSRLTRSVDDGATANPIGTVHSLEISG